MRTIDLNCDLGERPESIADGTDEALLEIVSSANIACGGHAGDDATMAATVRAALRHGVAIGAHPSYPDRAGFGRAAGASFAATEVERFVEAQIRALTAIAGGLGARLGHVKPHGALYHHVAGVPTLALALGRAVLRVDRALVLVGFAGSSALATWRRMGLAVAAEAFADRRYEPSGALRSRERADALLLVPSEAAEQAVRLARGARPRADTICVHGDTPGAVAIARAVRRGLEEAGVTISAF